MKNILMKILFEKDDVETVFKASESICILGWFDIVDELGNNLFGYNFDDDDKIWFELSANEDLFEWLSIICQVTLAICENRTSNFFYGYILCGAEPPYKGLVFSLNDGCFMIKHILHNDSDITAYRLQHTLPKDFEIIKNFQPINFQSWIKQVIATVNEFIDFVCSQNKTLEPHMYMQRMIKQVKEIEKYQFL